MSPHSDSAEVTVTITPVKRFVSERLDPRSPLAKVLLREKDQMLGTEFLSKLPIWLALLEYKERL